MITVLSSDLDLYAALSDHPAGVLVRLCRRSAWDPAAARPTPRLLAAFTVDAPFHLVADRVHDLLRDLDR